MRAWGYYAFHTFINSIKKMFRSVFLIVIGCCILFGILVGFTTTFIFDFNDQHSKEPTNYAFSELADKSSYVLFDNEDQLFGGKLSKDIYYSESDDCLTNEDCESYSLYSLDELSEDYIADALKSYSKEHNNASSDINDYAFTGKELKAFDYKTAEDTTLISDLNLQDVFTKENAILLIETISELLFIIFVLWAFYQGAKKGSDIFLMADVNFLFPAPLKPQSVLFFRLSFQLAATLLGCIYLVFQIPNLIANGVDMITVLICFLAFIILLMTQKIISVFAYTISATRPKLRKMMPYICMGIAAVIAGANYYIYINNGKDIIKTANLLYGNNYSRFIPLFGWFKAALATAVSGHYLQSIVYLLLFTAAVALITVATWKLKADFYEDAISGAEERDKILQAAQEKNQTTLVRKKDRSNKIKRNLGMKGHGAAMFFTKEMYNRKRMAVLGFFTNTTWTYLTSAVLPALFLTYALDTKLFAVSGWILAGVLFFRSLANSIHQEVNNVWLVLAPANPVSKVFYSTLAGTVACALDLIPAIIISAVITMANPLEVLVWFITLLLLNFMLSCTDVMFYALVPFEGMDVIKSMLQITLRFILATIIIVVASIVAIIAGIIPALLIVCAVSVGLGTLAFIIFPIKLEMGM